MRAVALIMLTSMVMLSCSRKHTIDRKAFMKDERCFFYTKDLSKKCMKKVDSIRLSYFQAFKQDSTDYYFLERILKQSNSIHLIVFREGAIPGVYEVHSSGVRDVLREARVPVDSSYYYCLYDALINKDTNLFSWNTAYTDMVITRLYREDGDTKMTHRCTESLSNCYSYPWRQRWGREW